LNQIYFGGFSDHQNVLQNFQEAIYNSHTEDYEYDELEGVVPNEGGILFASYGGACYEGDAVVIFQKNGKLYEVHGSHCSCYGLEGQWRPEETTLESLAHYPGEYFLSNHEEEAKKAFWALVDRLQKDSLEN
jgi:hypothetical protein